MDSKQNKSDPGPESEIQSAEVVLPCAELDETLAFFTQKLGFELELIFPADRPSTAVISGFGLRFRLEVGSSGSSPILRLTCRQATKFAQNETFLLAPNGTRIELVEANPEIRLPPERQTLVVTKMASGDPWVVGRAGLRYRDLIPGRQGGRFIASHIQITEGGPVPDYAHFHRVRFQMIYCYKGWVRVVYEDQGEPFVLQAGDCVLQPSQIRHRVLESSPGLEVIEVGCPAEHETYADHKIKLPTETIRSQREFSGQRFVHHRAAEAQWIAWRLPGFEARNIGIDRATHGLAGVYVVRPGDAAQPVVVSHDHEFLFVFVLIGSLTLDCGQQGAHAMTAGDACVIPKGLGHALTDCAPNLEFLEVRLPADFKTCQHAAELSQ